MGLARGTTNAAPCVTGQIDTRVAGHRSPSRGRAIRLIGKWSAPQDSLRSSRSQGGAATPSSGSVIDSQSDSHEPDGRHRSTAPRSTT